MQVLRARCSLLMTFFLAALPAVAAQREEVSTKTKVDLTPFAGDWKYRTELMPVMAGEEVLVTSTLRLFAFDAGTAELRWSAGPPKGWDELEPAARDRFFIGLDLRQPWIAPAAGARIAVAALQIPLSRHVIEEGPGIQRTPQIPERRLFAFELASGRPLWDHTPPSDWDGVGGSFAQRMTLIGSPTVVGEVVLAASWSDPASIDYHVSCYELATGVLSWSILLVRGQSERNMFGKVAFELSGAPLVAVPERGRVLAQTGRGLIAALDLATGEALWTTAYKAIEIPKPRSYTPPKREQTWRTTPPIVVGDVVLATPPDSRELLAFDLEDGHLLWSVAISELSTLDPKRGVPDIDHLIGADEDVIFLGGSRPSALRKPGGLRAAEAFERRWTVPTDLPESGRGQLSGEDIYFPRPYACAVFDRKSGRSGDSLVLDSARRGFLVTNEALYVLTDDGLERIER